MATTTGVSGGGTGFVAQARSLSRSYWVANAIEMVERLAYYGLRTVVPIYMVLAVEEGGPGLDHVQKGTIFAWWAMVQSFVPIVAGGYADRFGYRRTVAASVGVKVLGYLVMAFAVELGAWSTAGAAAGVPGHPAVYGWFLAGALLLALGTAIFKPGIQGLVATQVNERNGSLAWAIFYQVVNVGGFLGPFLAGAMRLLAWRWVFVACAAIICLNYLLLLFVAEPEREQRAAPGSVLSVLDRSVAGILEPRLLAFLAIFSGFWAMFYQLFDLLPNFIDDWVDTRGVFAAVVAPLAGALGASPPAAWGGRVPQEFMINLNAGLISVLAFGVGYLTGFVRPMTAMIAGILVSAAGIVLLGSASGWVVLGAIALFSMGEMMASPTKLRYFSDIAPPGQKGLYLGYINATTGIGWSLGSLIAGRMYDEGGDKVNLARRHLVDALGADPDQVAGLARTEVLPALAARLGDGAASEAVLWSAYEPWRIWTWFAVVGLVSMAGLLAFEGVTRRAPRWEEPALIAITGVVTGLSYGAGVGVGFVVLMTARRLLGNAWTGRLLLAVAAGWLAWRALAA